MPNLVWLPAQVAALTDREGSFVQNFTQALAIKIYRDCPVAPPVAGLAEAAWAKLPTPANVPPQGLPDIAELNFFEPTPAWWQRRTEAINQVVAALDARVNGDPLPKKVISSRYTAGLQSLPVGVAKRLRKELSQCVPGGQLPPL